MTTEAIRAWAAGFIDGEGCIQLVRTRTAVDGFGRYSLCVITSNTHKGSIDLMKREFGGFIRQKLPLVPGQRVVYLHKIHDRGAEDLLRAVQPYSVVKQEQIVAALEYRSLLVLRGKRYFPKSEAALRRMPEIAREMKAMKHTGFDIVPVQEAA